MRRRRAFNHSEWFTCFFAVTTLGLGVWGLAACGINPVTGKKEIQFISEAQELKLGEQNYAPTRQSEGGEFTLRFRIDGKQVAE